MARPKNVKVAIVCAWRKGEDDLQATVDSAVKSAGKNATVYAVEDKDAQGPGRTRHRGIEAAKDADVIVIIDAHMRFKGDALARMARHAAKSGLCCPLTFHNLDCSFSGTPYGGARIVYRAKDGKTHTPLAGKWARSNVPGPVGCVMGGCYAFRRDWYINVGQPLAMLTGWGCDEEALSIASWLFGQTPQCIDATVAHRYRVKPPWTNTPAEFDAVRKSRVALVCAVVSEITARHELTEWNKRCVPEGVVYSVSPECERFRKALLALPKKWHEWRAQVCEPDEIDGMQAREPLPVNHAAPRNPTQNPTVVINGVTCTHCKTESDIFAIRVTNTYGNGNRRCICPQCKNPFIAITKFLSKP